MVDERSVKEKAYLAVEAARDKKAEDIRLLEVGKLTIIADYFIICSGNNERQVEAIARGIKEDLGEEEIFPLRTAGREDARWILMDYADFIVHIFHHEERDFYELERLWADAKRLLAEQG